jgi:uncharacterized protein
MKTPKAKDVDSYIAQSVREAHPILREIRVIIKSAVPEVEEGISWGVPFYKYHGPLAGFATYKDHVSFGFAGSVLDEKDREMLKKKGCTSGIRTIQIKFDQPVPATTLKQIIKTKAKENKANKMAK